MRIADVVQVHQLAQADAVLGGYHRQRLTPLDAVELVRALGIEAGQLRHGPRIDISRQPQPEAPRHVLVTGPHRCAQRRVRGPQRLQGHVERRCQLRRRVEAVGLHHARGGRGLAFGDPEIAPGVAINIHRRQKRRIEIARGEPERARAIARGDLADVVRAQLAAGPAHAVDAMVVGGDGQRPAAGDRVVVFQQPHRRVAGQERIEPLVHHVIDAHEAPAGGARELPHAGGAHVGARARRERRFHVRQQCQLFRHPAAAHGGADVVQPASRPHHTRLEAPRQTTLEAQPAGSAGQPLFMAGKQRQHACMFGVEGPALTRRQRLENGRVAALDGAHHPRALAATAGWQVDALVDDVQVLIVVQQAAVGIDLGVHACPERDGRLQRTRAWQHSAVADRLVRNTVGVRADGQARQHGKPPRLHHTAHDAYSCHPCAIPILRKPVQHAPVADA